MGTIVLTADFYLSQKNYVTLVQSSIRETNYPALLKFGIVDGPQMSL